MSSEQIDALTARLQSAADRLRSGEISAEEAAGMIDECAVLAGQASSELASSARAAAVAPLPGQDRLL